MPEFLKKNQAELCYIPLLDEFQSNEHCAWGNQRNTFWGFVMLLLAGLYNKEDWQVMKRGAFPEIMSSFAWGNLNSIEHWGSTGKGSEANRALYDFSKKESEVFDKFEHLANVFELDVAIIMSSDKSKVSSYLGNIPSEDFKDVKTYNVGKCLVINMPHPQARGYYMDDFANTINEILDKKGFALPKQAVSFVASSTDIQGLQEYFLENIKTKDINEALAIMATELKKRDMTMSVPFLFTEIINKLGIKTTYGTEYQGERGSYKAVSSAYDHYEKLKKHDIAKSIACAFTNSSGAYPFE